MILLIFLSLSDVINNLFRRVKIFWENNKVSPWQPPRVDEKYDKFFFKFDRLQRNQES
jgi:hypothetical protein